MTKYLVQNKMGKQRGVIGTKILLDSGTERRALTVHGYTMKELYDKIYFFLYNDNFEEHRKNLLLALPEVDEVIITGHLPNTEDMSVCRELIGLRPDTFANGGDRKEDNVPEVALCNKLGIKLEWNIGGEKKYSSSEAVKRAKK